MNLLKNLVKLLFWLAGLAVIAAAAAVILVSTIDPNEHKDWITARIQHETGRSISLDGPLAITLYPWLGVEAQQVSVANAEGFGAEPLAYLDYVKLRVRTLPLLREEYEVDTIAVKGAVVNLARNGQGSANWEGLDGVDEAADAAGDEALLPLAAVALGGVAIEDARVVLDDQQDGVRYEVSGLDVSTAELKYGEPVDVNLNFRGSSNKPALEAVVALAGNITYATDGQRFAIAPLDINAEIEGGNIPGGRTSARLSATLDVNLDEETLVLDRFTLEGLGLETSGDVEVNDIFADPAVSGELEVQPFNLRRLARQLKQELPATQGDDTFTRVSLAGRFDRTAHGLSLDQLELQLDDTRLTGEFMLDSEASGPVVQFDLDIDQIDLDGYLPPASTKAGRLAAFPVVAAAYADMDGDVSIDRLVVADARLDGFRLHLEARNGVVQAEPLTAALYEGRLSADISLDAKPAVPVLTLNANLADIQAEPLLMDVKGKARLRGRGNFSAALTAEGASIAAMKRSLEGAMSLTFTEGAIAGFNLGRTLRQWQQFSKGRIVNLEENAATDFTELSGNPVANNGIIRMDDLVLKAPAFRLQGTGVLANLHTDTIDYQAVATVVNTAKGAGGKELAELEGLQLPLKVEGALDNPKIRLAWEDILSGLLIEKVLDVLDLPLPGREQPEDSENDAETEEESDFDPVKELLKEGLKEGLKGIFKKN